MKRRYVKNKLFFKYLASYLIILLIPLLGFSAFINNSVMNVIHKQLLSESTQSLYQFETDLDNAVSRLVSIRDILISNGDLKVAPDLQDVAQSQKLIRTLKNYAISNSLLSDIVYYQPGDTYVYTARSSFLLSSYFSQGEYPGNWNEQEFLSVVKALDTVRVHTEDWTGNSGEEKKLMTMMYPIKQENGTGVLMFILEIDKMLPQNRDAAFFVRNKDGEVLLSCFPKEFDEETWSTVDWEEVFDGKESPFNYEDELVSATKSTATGWEYIKISPISQVNKTMHSLWNRFGMVQIMIVLLGSVLIWVNMKVNYQPLKGISQLLQNGQKGRRDGVNGIYDAVENLTNENQKLRVQTVVADRSQFMRRLLKGKIPDQQTFRETIAELDMKTFDKPYFYVLVLLVRPEMIDKVSTEAVERCMKEEGFFETLGCYLRETSECGKIIFVGSCEHQDQILLTRQVMEMQEALRKRLDSDMLIAVSAIREGFENVPQCYMDAMIAADCRFIKGYNCVIDSTMVVVNGDIGMAYPQKLFDRLNYQIKNGDADKIQQSLNEIIEYVKDSQLPLYYAKGLCYQLINNISAILEQLNRALPPEKRIKLPSGTMLADFETIDDLIGRVSEISIEICEFIRDERSENDTRTATQIREYLEKNIFDPNFAIQTMAADLDMSLTKLSSSFKNQYGETLSDYVTHCRMEEAVRLLLEGNTVGDVVVRVGYLNVSSFIRKFKSIYGLTPGQYVKEYKEKEKN